MIKPTALLLVFLTGFGCTLPSPVVQGKTFVPAEAASIAPERLATLGIGPGFRETTLDGVAAGTQGWVQSYLTLPGTHVLQWQQLVVDPRWHNFVESMAAKGWAYDRKTASFARTNGDETTTMTRHGAELRAGFPRLRPHGYRTECNLRAGYLYSLHLIDEAGELFTGSDNRAQGLAPVLLEQTPAQVDAKQWNTIRLAAKDLGVIRN